MKRSLINTLAGASLTALLLTGCAAHPVAQNAGISAATQVAVSTPSNLGELKSQLVDYQRSGDYERDVAAVVDQARAYIEGRASQTARPAIVLDIDETSLSNWPEILANDFGYISAGGCSVPVGPCGMGAWIDSARAPAVAPTLALFKAARAKGVAVFFITGRSEASRAATELNLRAVGYDGWAGLVMRPTGTSTPSASDYKAPERAKIMSQGYTIIANIGDQPSDLAGGSAERTFLVPNPFYRIL